MGPSEQRTWRLAAAVPFVVATVAVSVAAGSGQQASPTPLQLFQKMMPAIRHPRCTNCHGVVDPETGANHKPGRIARDPKDSTHQDCTSCHSDSDEWQIPGSEHFFFGRTDKEICNQVSDFVTTFGRQPFLKDHIRGDHQIIEAFKGLAAGARIPGGQNPDGSIDPPADPPTMTHNEFIAAADDWVLKGGAACVLEGTILWEESVESVDTVENSSQKVHIVTQAGSRTVNLSPSGSGFRADITVTGTIVSIATIFSTDRNGRRCVVTVTDRTNYAGTTGGPAKVTIKDTAFMIPAPVPPQTDYRIDITLPPEKATRTEAVAIQNGCGTPMPPMDGSSERLEWDEWDLTIEGRQQDRAKNAIGGCQKTVTQDQAGKTLALKDAPCNRYGHMGNANEPWLMNHGADVAFHDGRYIPFRVNISWNLRRR